MNKCVCMRSDICTHNCIHKLLFTLSCLFIWTDSIWSAYQKQKKLWALQFEIRRKQETLHPCGFLGLRFAWRQQGHHHDQHVRMAVVEYSSCQDGHVFKSSSRVQLFKTLLTSYTFTLNLSLKMVGVDVDVILPQFYLSLCISR